MPRGGLFGLTKRKDDGSPLRPSRVIVGLGNPGSRYAGNRHNVGFRCVDRLCREYSIPLSVRSRLAIAGEGLVEGHPVVLAKPRTYMNRSGEAISYLLARYKATIQTLLIIYDDMDLPLGKVRIRPRGSAGGHNGIQSIVDALGSEEFQRIRVGIGRPVEGVDPVQYVLEDFLPQERRVIEEAMAQVPLAVACLLTEGIDQAMSRFN